MVDGMHAVVFVDNHDNQVTILVISTFGNSRHPLDQLDHLDHLDQLVQTARSRRRRRSSDCFQPDWRQPGFPQRLAVQGDATDRDSKPKVKSLQISRSPSVPSVFLADQCNKVLGQISDRVNQVAVAFMLGHDYGFKRIMSSYYFQDTDQVLNNQQKSCFKSSNMIVVLAQGPPGGAPASFPNACGNGWTCEHRL